MSPIDGLVLVWHIPTELSSAQSQSQSQSRTQSRFCLSKSLPRVVIFLIFMLRKGFLPAIICVCTIFLQYIFLLLISVSCHHLNLPLTITSMYLSLPPTRLDLTQGQKARWPIKVGIKGEGKVGNKPRLKPCRSVLLIDPLIAMWVQWDKQFHESKFGSGHVCQVIA